LPEKQPELQARRSSFQYRDATWRDPTRCGPWRRGCHHNTNQGSAVMSDEELEGPPVPAESESERKLREKLDGRTVALVLVSVAALIELLIIVQLAMK
jgi:hypothetical protein